MYPGGELTINIINRILSLMNDSSITAKQLTTELELSNSSITDWKKGKAKPSTDAIVKIADFFNVSTDYLLTGKKTVEFSFSTEDSEWLELIHQLPYDAQLEFKGEIRGYLKHLNKESVAADKPLKKTGTDNLGK